MKKKSSNSSKKKYTRISNGKNVEFKSFETYLIDRFIDDKRNISYPREIGIAKKLGKITKLQEFWDSITVTKVSSLCYFIKKENYDIIMYQFQEFEKKRWQEFLEKKAKSLDIPEKEAIILSDKVGVDVEIKKPILSLKDFLKYGQTS
jgi:hypothetical protein